MNMGTWGYIRHLFFAEKFSKRNIAKQLNLDPKTVRRAIKKETYISVRKPGKSKLDPFRERIGNLLRDYPHISAVRIGEEIRKDGYKGGMSILRTYIKTVRPNKKVFLNIQREPGEEAQVDWAHAGRIEDKTVYCFLMVLSFSKMLYIELFSSQNMENFLAGHVHAFHYFKGVPKKIRYDNLKSVVVTRFGSNVQFNARFMSFAAHYLFDPSVCNVRRPHEKGRVENAVKYVKNNFLVGRTFLSLTDYNQQAALWMDQTANVRSHGTTKVRPCDIFLEKEQSLLIPLPAIDDDIRIVRTVKSSSQCLVCFETNRYSVPFTHASMNLTLKADDQFISIYDKEQLIAQHGRCSQKQQLIENPQHIKEMLPCNPHGAFLKHRDAITAIGQGAKEYLNTMMKMELNVSLQLKKMVNLIDLFGKTELAAAMEQALRHKAIGYEYLQNIILANRRKRAETKTPGSPSSKINPDMIRNTWVEERNPEIYDHLFSVKELNDDNSSET